MFDDRHRIAEHLEPGRIEAHGAQRAGRRVKIQVAGVDVLGLAAAANQHLALAGRQIEHGHLRVVRLSPPSP